MYHIFRQNNLYFEVSVMRQADALTKEYLSNNEIFADVFNYLIYDGQQKILPENLIERDTSEITLPLGKRGELATIQKFRDILKGYVAMLLYILAMTNGMQQKAFKKCFLRQMNLLRIFFQITNFI